MKRWMRYCAGVVLGCLLAVPAWAIEDKKALTLHNATSSTADGVEFELGGIYNTVILEITISDTATVTFQTMGFLGYYNRTCVKTTDTGGALVASVTASTIVQCNVTGMAKFKAPATISAGTVTVEARASTGTMSGGGGGGGAGTQYNEDAAHTTGDTGTMLLCVRNDTAGALAGTDGDYIPCSTTSTGAQRVHIETSAIGTTDPCTTEKKTFVPISQAASTQLLTGTASNRTFVCDFIAKEDSSSTQTWSLVSGTGTTCGTGTTALFGATTAANGMTGGFSLGNGGASIAKSGADADNICLLQSGTDRINGSFGYVTAAN